MTEIKGAVVGSAERDWESWADPEFRARSPIRWKILVDGALTPSRDLTMGVAEIPPGESLPPHRHEPAELYYIEDGQGDVEIDGARRPVGPNDTVFCSGGCAARADRDRDGAAALSLDPARRLFCRCRV